MGRKLRRDSRTAIALAFAGAILAGTSASAHRRDELLQAARVDIDSQWVDVEMSITPGIAVADAVIRGIDHDNDGTLSEDEKRAFIDDALASMTLSVDGRALPIHIESSTFPPLEALRGGDAAIEFLFGARLPSSASGTHRVSFTNVYRPDIGVYMVNALQPADDLITIGAQNRDPQQRTTTIDFSIASTRLAPLPLLGFVPAVAAWLFVRRRELAS